ncbi:hypothetical protein [Lapidilactobacillus gannanensis]|uniref:Lipoprotein n=1 Tax=Lapidilactobacillus gannanensis TaxID=2486002 RepID=A0ABW4BN80_9LACO|nr:hypothetical protein [Lapidilactobacillus gannanensis]
MKQFRKFLLLLLPLIFLLTACQSQTTTKNSGRTSSSSKQTSTSSKTTSNKKVKLTTVPLIGTWTTSAGVKFTFNPDGKWIYETSNGAKTDGTFQIAGATGRDVLVKLHGLDQDIGGIGNYLGVRFDTTKKKLMIVGFGRFTLTGEASQLTTDLLLPKAFSGTPNTFREELVGTWMNTDESATDALTTNYNPDGTYERYSSVSKQVETGKFMVISNHSDNKKLEIKYTPATGKAYTTSFTRDNGISQLTTSSKGIVTTYVKNQIPE